jgi:hypothetical protein
VTRGVTFAFGGLRIITDGEVLNTENEPDRGLRRRTVEWRSS